MPPEAVPEGHAAGHLQDAEFAITSFSSWIVSADTKAGLLSAATALLVGALAGERAHLAAAAKSESGIAIAVLALFAFTVAALLVTAAFLGGVLYPRRSRLVESRFSWPRHVALPLDIPQLVGSTRDEHTIASEAWLQATALASIAQSKFRAFQIALIVFAFSVLGFLALVGTSAFLST
jgi:hypothetical protein